MAGDMNACIEGCFAAGATEVVVRDHHSSGRNVDPDLIDKCGAQDYPARFFGFWLAGK
jgi:D-aminopeptidase